MYLKSHHYNKNLIISFSLNNFVGKGNKNFKETANSQNFDTLKSKSSLRLQPSNYLKHNKQLS